MSIARKIFLSVLVLGITLQGLLTYQSAGLYGEGKPKLVMFGIIIFALDIAYAACLLAMSKFGKGALLCQVAIFVAMVALGALYLGGNWAQILYTHWLLVPASLIMFVLNSKVQAANA